MREVTKVTKIEIEVWTWFGPFLVRQAKAGRVVQRWRHFKDGNGVDSGNVAARVYMSKQ